MVQENQFRRILPASQTVLAAFFGGLGLWQRNEILSHSLFGWDSTARFHVWPWPFKFAAVVNMPAFLAGMLLAWPIGDRWPWLPESVLYVPLLLLVPILWYWIGSWLDRRWGVLDKTATHAKLPWVLLLLFTLGAMGASTTTSVYLLCGLAAWMIVGLGATASAIYRKFLSPAA